VASAGEQWLVPSPFASPWHGEKKVIPMALSWDLPVAQFGGAGKWVRHYRPVLRASGTNAWKIARTALENNQNWSSQIDAWQKPYVEDRVQARVVSG